MVSPSNLDKTHRDALHHLRIEVRNFLHGKDGMADSIIACLISGGHILLEDVPGVGKTTFIKALAKMLGLSMKRVQFTSDLLPSDILGVQVYDQDQKNFSFHKGPIFSNIIFADELNRASPKTQSALLEAMGEAAVTIDRSTYPLDRPFLVVAAQNPSHHMGTFPIPESQLDRFAIKVKIDYPSYEKELQIFSQARLDPLKGIDAEIITASGILELQRQVENIHVSNEIGSCVKQLVDASRDHKAIELGISTRGGVQWVRLAKGLAILEGRSYIIPDDLIQTSEFCLIHRMVISSSAPQLVLEELLQKMEI